MSSLWEVERIPVNEQRLKYYAKFVDDLLAAGIAPLITLFYWDLPGELHSRYGGLLSTDFVADYANYARVGRSTAATLIHATWLVLFSHLKAKTKGSKGS